MNTCFVCYSISLLHSLSIPFLSPPRSLISSLIQSLSLSSDRLLIILLCEPMRVWKPLCKCVCVCVCLGGSTEACFSLPNKRVSWVRIPMQEYLPSNNTIIFQPTSVPSFSKEMGSPLICKTGTWSCTAHWLCLNCPLMASHCGTSKSHNYH